MFKCLLDLVEENGFPNSRLKSVTKDLFYSITMSHLDGWSRGGISSHLPAIPSWMTVNNAWNKLFGCAQGENCKSAFSIVFYPQSMCVIDSELIWK